jgi:apolipoprotein N-acyltransferase
MKEVVKTIGEIFVGIGMFAVIFFITWTLTSFDVIGVLFVSAVLFSMVFLPIILGAEEK